VKYHLIPVKRLFINKATFRKIKISIDKDMEKGEPLNTAGENVT
jgi:hypothetical protein